MLNYVPSCAIVVYALYICVCVYIYIYIQFQKVSYVNDTLHYHSSHCITLVYLVIENLRGCNWEKYAKLSLSSPAYCRNLIAAYSGATPHIYAYPQ